MLARLKESPSICARISNNGNKIQTKTKPKPNQNKKYDTENETLKNVC